MNLTKWEPITLGEMINVETISPAQMARETLLSTKSGWPQHKWKLLLPTRWDDLQRHLHGRLLKSPVTPKRRPHSVSTAFNLLQIAEVRAVQSSATLWKRYDDAVQSPRTPCLTCLNQTPRLGVCTACWTARCGDVVETLWGLVERIGRAACAL